MSPRTWTISASTISAALAAALVLATAACASDDVAFPDGGNGGGADGGGGGSGDATAASCATPVGSCLATGATMCQDYAGLVPAGTAQQECVASGGTWSTTPCATTSTSGGCRFEQPNGTGGQWCATTWFFPPTTTSDVIAACPSPGIYIPPT